MQKTMKNQKVIVNTTKRKPTRTRGKTFEYFYNEKNNLWVKMKKKKN